MRSNRTLESVVAGLGLLVLVLFGVVVPSARGGGLEVDVTVVLISILASAILLVLLGIRGRRT